MMQNECSGEKVLPSNLMDERELRHALDNLPAITWYSNPNGEIEFINKRWTEYSGISLEQSVGRQWRAFVHPDDLGRIRASGHDGPPTGNLDAEIRYRRYDGAYRWFRVQVGVMLDGESNPVRRYGFCIDIEDYKQATAARARVERYLNDAQRLSKTGSFVVNFTTKEHVWSDETYRIYEYEIGSQPTAAHVLDRVHPEDRAMLAENFARRDERRPLALRYRLLFPDGRIKYIQVMGMPDDASAPGTTYIGALMDVTDVSLAEDALHRAHAALSQATRASTLGELAASIAHEVNQPLAGIVSNGEACMRWLNRPEPDLDEVRKSLQQIISDGQRAAQVIRRLRALARKGDPEHVPLNINDVVVEIVPFFQRQLTPHAAVLKLRLDHDLPKILGDKIQLQQVIINLVSNGVQAMGQNGISGTELEIQSWLDRDGRVGLAVSDSGGGIAPEAMQTLFDPFFTTKENGMGMGLSICRSIIEAHGGVLLASNNDTGGATLTALLPACSEAADD